MPPEIFMRGGAADVSVVVPARRSLRPRADYLAAAADPDIVEFDKV